MNGMNKYMYPTDAGPITSGMALRSGNELNSLDDIYNALKNETERLVERAHAIRSSADFLTGQEPTKEAGEAKLNAVPVSILDSLREQIKTMERLLNALAHDSGRLERALRG